MTTKEQGIAVMIEFGGDSITTVIPIPPAGGLLGAAGEDLEGSAGEGLTGAAGD